MEVYTVTVATGTSEYSGTNNYIFVTLIGDKGESERTLLDNPGLDFCRGAVDQYKVSTQSRLGTLLLVRLEKEKYWVEDNWFCRYVMVEPPDGGKVRTFPCYRWLIGNTKVEIREGTAKTLLDDSLPTVVAHRKAELQERQKTYRWVTWAKGIPRCIDAKTEADLPQDVRFDNEKRSDFEHSLHYALLELSLKKLAIRFGKSWNDLDDFKRIFWKLRSPIAEYCMEHWKEDWFFGYQCLNGCNPRMIQRCQKLPENFPVTADMVQSSMASKTTLNKELQAGNIYLLDYSIMDGIPANTIKGKLQYIAAPICLLYQHPDDGLIPIAIQLEQSPGLETPIFLPKDAPLAWLFAKMWVRHSEFQVFQLLSHLLRTHLVVEVFCVATLRQLPAVHPIYKLLAPHLRYTLEINCRGRTQLISANGIFKRVVSTGGDGLLILAQREYKVLTYRSLQPHYDFSDRGVSQLPNYFYREHSLMLWEAVHSFVSSMVNLYYHTDQDVQKDPELQAWIRDISLEGFTELPSFGNSLSLEMQTPIHSKLIYRTFSTQQTQIQKLPPPADKDDVTMERIMATLPDVSQSCVQMAITWILLSSAQIPLGQYTEDHFTEEEALEVVDSFRTKLKEIENYILDQNAGLDLQYLFLLPSRVENSITI
uniref:Arachidonate 12-lipoxygenase, 12S type n=1 Tax=Nothobranchius furzeri TaxID=105023 RepID=A0A8C6NUJ2_NOTFU